MTVPIIGLYINRCLKKVPFSRSISFEDYIIQIAKQFRICLLLIVVLLGKFWFLDSIVEICKSGIKSENDLVQLLEIVTEIGLGSIPTISIHIFLKIEKSLAKYRSNRYSIVSNILLNLFYYLSSSLIIYLIVYNNYQYLLPYLALSNLIMFINNISIDYLFIGGSSSRPRLGCHYVLPQNMCNLEGPPSIETNNELKERVRRKI